MPSATRVCATPTTAPSIDRRSTRLLGKVWERPRAPVLCLTFEGLQNWMYGSPEDGPRTGRASAADYLNDQVLANINGTEQLVHAAGPCCHHLGQSG